MNLLLRTRFLPSSKSRVMHYPILLLLLLPLCVPAQVIVPFERMKMELGAPWESRSGKVVIEEDRISLFVYEEGDTWYKEYALLERKEEEGYRHYVIHSEQGIEELIITEDICGVMQTFRTLEGEYLMQLGRVFDTCPFLQTDPREERSGG